MHFRATATSKRVRWSVPTNNVSLWSSAIHHQGNSHTVRHCRLAAFSIVRRSRAIHFSSRLVCRLADQYTRRDSGGRREAAVSPPSDAREATGTRPSPRDSRGPPRTDDRSAAKNNLRHRRPTGRESDHLADNSSFLGHAENAPGHVVYLPSTRCRLPTHQFNQYIFHKDAIHQFRRQQKYGTRHESPPMESS